MSWNYATLRAEERPGDVLLVTPNRPEVANAFNTQAALALCDGFNRLEAEQRYRRVYSVPGKE